MKHFHACVKDRSQYAELQVLDAMPPLGRFLHFQHCGKLADPSSPLH